VKDVTRYGERWIPAFEGLSTRVGSACNGNGRSCPPSLGQLTLTYQLVTLRRASRDVEW